MYFRRESRSVSREFEVTGAADVTEVLEWAERSASGDEMYVVYAVVGEPEVGLLRVHGHGESGVRLAADDVRALVPAKDFARSKVFYESLGWTTVWTDGDGLALMELAGHRFRLQDYYVKQWAENFMLTVVVDDAHAWHEHVTHVLAGGDHGDAQVAEPKVEDWGATVTYVWDPCGVLLHFTQFDEV